MPKRLSQSQSKDFEPKRKNSISLGSDSNIDNDFKPLKIGDIPTGLEFKLNEIRSVANNFVTLAETTESLSVTKIKGNRAPSIGQPSIIFQHPDQLDNSKGLWFQVFETSGALIKASAGGTTGQFSLDTEAIMHFHVGDNFGAGIQLSVGAFGALDRKLAFFSKDNDFTIYSGANENDYFKIDVNANANTVISTVDAVGESGDLTLDVDGTLTLNADSGYVVFMDNTTYHMILDANLQTLTLYEDSDINDYFQIGIANNGVTTLSTVDNAGADAHLKFNPDGSFLIKEKSSAGADVSTFGQLWVKDDTPNNLYFVNDAGDEVQITNGSSLAGGGGGASALNDLSDVTYSSGDLTITSLDKIIASTALTIQTTDSGGHAADLTFDIDGDAIFDMNSDANNRIKFEFGQAGNDLFQIKADASFNAIEMGGEDGNFSLIKLFGEGGSSANDFFQIFVEAQGVTEISTVDSSGANGNLSINPDGQLRFEKPPRVKEQASADSDQASYGQLWVKNDTPNNLYFTNDAGNDVQITNGSSLAGGGGGGGTQCWTTTIGGFSPNNSATNYYTQSYPNYYYWSNTDSSPSSISYLDSYAYAYKAPKDGTLTKICFTGRCTRTDPFKIYIYKYAWSTGDTSESGTLIGTSATITPPATNQAISSETTISSSNTFSAGDTLYVWVKKDSTSGQMNMYMAITIQGEYS